MSHEFQIKVPRTSHSKNVQFWKVTTLVLKSSPCWRDTLRCGPIATIIAIMWFPNLVQFWNSNVIMFEFRPCCIDWRRNYALVPHQSSSRSLTSHAWSYVDWLLYVWWTYPECVRLLALDENYWLRFKFLHPIECRLKTRRFASRLYFFFEYLARRTPPWTSG